MKLPYPLIPETREQQFYLMYGIAFAGMVFGLYLANMGLNVDAGFQEQLIEAIHESNLTVIYRDPYRDIGGF